MGLETDNLPFCIGAQMSPRCLWVVDRSVDPHADPPSVAKESLCQIRCPGQRPLGGVGEAIFHSAPDNARNFYAVLARPGDPVRASSGDPAGGLFLVTAR
jgi:hypothetical protein